MIGRIRHPAGALWPIAGAAVLWTSLLGAASAFDPKTMDSVVAVLPEWPAGGRPAEEPEGTAVAVLPGGFAATNVHVLGRATAVRIRLSDGRLLKAEIVGRDPPTDIALIKVPIDLPVAPVNAEPKLAERVCAVGNQFGLGLSVTCGVVSAVRRTAAGFNPVEDFVQTDAVVNPGGSGGALVDAQGRMVGLVSAIFTKKSDANIGVNFAASMPLVMRVVEDLKAHGRVKRVRSGLAVEDLGEAERATLSGARIARIQDGSPAAVAGLKIGDLIVAVDKRPVYRATDVTAAIYLRRPGERAEIEYRRDGARATATLSFAP